MGAVARLGDYAFTDADFRDIAGLAHASFGLHLEPCKKQLVYSRLAKRLRLLGLESFEDYRNVLRGPVGPEEQREMLSALTTNVTQFFREKHHFEKLRVDVIPGLVERARAGARVRLWSAGCSAGQEPYSLALTILDVCPDAARLDLRILATDVDPTILQRAARGRYPSSERAAIPTKAASAHLETDGDSFVMGDAAKRMIAFGELNLMQAWPMKGAFDVILCRNVAIYFDADTQAKLWKRFADLLVPRGHLMIGHSERVSGPASAMLRSCGITSYQKTPSGPAAGQARRPSA